MYITSIMRKRKHTATSKETIKGVIGLVSNPAPSGRINVTGIRKKYGTAGLEVFDRILDEYPHLINNEGDIRVSYYWTGTDYDAGRLEEELRCGTPRKSVTPAPAPVPVPAPVTPTPAPEAVLNLTTRGVASVSSSECFVPKVDPTFVSWGSYSQVKKIIQSKLFFPLYISGMSGNGKTFMVEQACAKLKREYVRVQISPETDEDDLLGGFRLINGETVFQKGPVVKALESGAILLIDEIDRGTNKVMCLQGVLEGKPILLKKIGQMVEPAEGFNVIATANTNGRGSEDGRYSAAQIIDDAFIERFVATIVQPYPELSTERKIVAKHMDALDLNDEQFVNNLVAWSQVIRKTFAAEGVDEVISTRRLCHIVKAFSVFEDRLGAIKLCISRFEEETREAFLDLYTKIDAGELNAESEEDPAVETHHSEPLF